MLTLVQRPAVRVVMVGLVLLTIQTTVLADLRPFGVNADIMLGAAVCAGLVAGPERGAMTGFVYGMMFDLLLVSPMGLSGFAYGMTAFAIGAAKSLITLTQAWWFTMAAVLVGSIGGIVLFAVSGALVGQQGWVRFHLIQQALVVGSLNAVIGPPLGRVMKWALRVEREQ